MRYFRANAAVYEEVRAMLNQAWGYPNAETKTLTAIPPASDLPTDSGGMVYLAVDSQYCEYILPAELLPNLLASGDVEEITAGEYASVFPPLA